MKHLIDRRKLKFDSFKLRRDSQKESTAISKSEPSEETTASSLRKALPDMFVQCPNCKADYTRHQLRENLYVCPDCGFHYAMPPEKRVKSLVDEGSFKTLKSKFPVINPLHFNGYVEKKEALQEKTGQEEAVLTGVGKIDGRKAVICVMNSKFLMGSMGIQVGEMITSATEYADKYKLPLIIFTASGGARMQEGILSLMQMAKTSAAMEKFQKNGGLYIAVLTHPTTGGVSASFATLGDITLAEPGALIGFAGPRVIEQTIGQKLPEGFQRAEYLLEHGFVDKVLPRAELKKTISQLLMLHSSCH